VSQYTFDIRSDDLRGPQVQALLAEHLRDMRAWSPPCSVHALNLDGLRQPEVSFWAVWLGNQVVGCGALKALNAQEAEIKSMRTTEAVRGQGVGRLMLAHILAVAQARRYRQLWLETGAQAPFAPARALYASAGFVECGPFSGYQPDAASVFMTKALSDD
jgi:putative acetyltransferase